jgi:hypothetical protein
MRKLIITAVAAALAVPAVASAAGPELGSPGCFGQWRADAVHEINAGEIAGYENTGQLLSERAGDNAAQNLAALQQCA